MVAPSRSDAAAPPHVDALWRLGRLSLDCVLDSIELSRAGDDVVDRLLLATILDANQDPLKQDVGLQMAYGGLDDAPPESVRRPVSVSGVALSLRLPFETVRRRVRRLASQGAVVVTPHGILVSQARIESAAFKALNLARYERLRRFHHDLVQAHMLPPLPAATGVGDAPPSAAPPVRAVNRVLAEFLMRCIDAITSRVGDPLDGLLLLHIARFNLPSVERQGARLAPVRTAVLADVTMLSYETIRRRLLALEQAGVCRRSRKGVILAPEIVAHPSVATLLQENAANVERMFTRLARLGVLATWETEPATMAPSAAPSP